MTTRSVEQLIRLGFTRYEAQGYVTLLRRSPLTGYELAKLSGVPRANIYEVLERLQERGTVMRVEEERTTRYVPIASDRLLGRLRRDFERTLEDAQSSLQAIGRNTRWEPVMNARGYASALSLARELISSATSELLIAVWPQEAEALAAATEEACNRGVAITTLCLAGCRHECGLCRGAVHRYRVAPDTQTRWLVLSSDGGEILTGEIRGDETVAVRTRQRLLVELAGWYIRHTIAVAAIVRDLDARKGSALSPQTKAILRSIGTNDSGRDWLAHLRSMIAASDAKGNQ